MTKDIERVAKAIGATDVSIDDDILANLVTSGELRSGARAAILAMLPPSDAMVEAAAIARIEEIGMVDWVDASEDKKNFLRGLASASITAALRAAAGEKP